ncbi:hypothetical protein SAMN05880501_10623 [Ureibacillus xyleni]|uniref:Uncharacterized protein n=1 Tax=Ureibacillus xyleni TaxID=614648 RepID=A0A285SRP4_9BACL|nr:hypothetical protein [Ureibacillus xyleni]SOC10653.1 hypothetical protein SAMN05880501_10623 [Ureibacillus xyleni]
MNTMVWVLILLVVAYTMGFSIQLWKHQNKIGSIATFLLALAVIITPFLSVFRW